MTNRGNIEVDLTCLNLSIDIHTLCEDWQTDSLANDLVKVDVELPQQPQFDIKHHGVHVRNTVARHILLHNRVVEQLSRGTGRERERVHVTSRRRGRVLTTKDTKANDGTYPISRRISCFEANNAQLSMGYTYRTIPMA